MKSVGTYNLSPTINVCDIHPRAPLLAWYATHSDHYSPYYMFCLSLSVSLSLFVFTLAYSASHQQQAIRIFNLERNEVLNTIRYHDGFMGQKIGSSNCLAFHPYKVRNQK